MRSKREVSVAVIAAGLLASSAWLASAQPSSDEAYTKAVATIYVVSRVGGFVKNWCDARAPQTKAVTDKGLAAWRKTFKLDEVDARMKNAVGNRLESVNTSLEAKREETYQNLDRASRNPGEDCKGIETYLNTEVNPRTLYPAEYALVFSRPLEAPAPITSRPPPAPTPTATANFGNLEASQVLESLRPLGAKAPLKSGGALKLGAYRCAQVRFYGSRSSTHEYTLNLYADRGLRVDAVKIEGKPGREFVGTYTYKPDSGEITSDGDYDNDDLEDYAMFNGTYNSITEQRTLVNAFRFFTDAQNIAFFYGQQEYSDESATACRYAGASKTVSPVELERQKEARAIAERDRFRSKPNAGLKLAQIEGIVHDYETTYQVTGMRENETSSLLLKDGSMYTNLQYTPHDLNVAASKKGEPKYWTKWRRSGGALQYLAGNAWKKLEGFLVQPGGKNETIKGVFQYLSSYTLGTSSQGTTSILDITYSFSGDKFIRYSGNTTSGSTLDVFSYATSSRDQKGSYTFDGYTLELRFENGKVNRTYGYYWDKKKDSLVIDGTTYSRPK
jgi:hypothetical protein